MKTMKKAEQSKVMWNKYKPFIWAAAAVVIYIVIMLLDGFDMLSRHQKSLLIPILVNVILAVSLNLTTGFLGELTLGHAGFMSVGAYAGCLLSLSLDIPEPFRIIICLVFGGLVAAVFGLIIGVPVLRLKGDYLAIVTLAFGEIIRSVIVNLEFTGGAAGLKGIPRSTTFTIAFLCAAITIVVIRNLVYSRQGLAIRSIRDNRIAAESIGMPVSKYKVLAFVIAAFFAGVAGVLYGQNLGHLSPSDFDYNKSIEILVIVVLGGMGSLTGSVISAIVITVLPEVLRGADDYRMLLYAVVLIVMMILNASPKAQEMKANLAARFRRRKPDGVPGGKEE
ncbi:MAG: branched-chain amino acid ABC transporter permease [Lachnospiraceae bacterium]|nr:branched-chain amino acid ABC transporter permease [Lachnospiraceae bacterium]